MPELDAFAALEAGHVIDDDVHQSWRIARAPTGNVTPEDFTWHEAAVPEPGDGEVLLKTLYLGLAPVMRFYMQGLPAAGEVPLSLGDIIHGRGVAQIVKSRNAAWREGEIVQGQLGWQTYKVSGMTAKEKFIRMPNNGLPAALGAGVLGMKGMSAYAGYMICGEPRAGDLTVLSGAAGGVGSLVSQMAANVVGAKVIGIAGGPEKCALIKRYGCAEAIDYKSDDVGAMLDAFLPDGLDMYFDNIGGKVLDLCLDRLRLRARIILCGAISEYVEKGTTSSLPGYRRIGRTDSRLQGFFVYNYMDQWTIAMEHMADWIKSGKLQPLIDENQGFQSMPRALARMYYGRNVGVTYTSVRGEPDGWG